MHVTGSWAFTTTQESLEVAGASHGGCKHSASAAVLGTPHCGHIPRQLVSAADFSPTHFNEPRSDMPALHILALVASNVNSSPALSTFSVNPLLHRDPSATPLIHSHAPLNYAAWL